MYIKITQKKPSRFRNEYKSETLLRKENINFREGVM